jgi:recombination protein RecT
MAEEQKPTTELAKKPELTGPLARLMGYTQDPDTQRRIKEMLGDAAGTFTNSLINVVKGNTQLMDIAVKNPASIMTSAMRAASVRLPIDPALGFAAIVPYGGKEPAAQFQLMYKGLIQLAIRTGQYKRMHDTVVYKDELECYNPITGVVEFTDPSTWKMRTTKKDEDVAGFYFEFELVTGFVASKFLSFEDAMAWGTKYSKAYGNDLKYKKASSLWSTNPIAMGMKTCIKMLLGKYGILSVEIQQAMVDESDDFNGQTIDAEIVDRPRGVEGVMKTLQGRQNGNGAASEAPSTQQGDQVPGGEESQSSPASDESPSEPGPVEPEGGKWDPEELPLGVPEEKQADRKSVV